MYVWESMGGVAGAVWVEGGGKVPKHQLKGTEGERERAPPSLYPLLVEGKEDERIKHQSEPLLPLFLFPFSFFLLLGGWWDGGRM